MIKVGATLPDVLVCTASSKGLVQVRTSDLFSGKRAVLFSVPGAFTPTCSAKHLPGYIEKGEDFRGRGVEVLACLSTNDGFVMRAWEEQSGADGTVIMIADGNGDLVKAMGLEADHSGHGMGWRAQRAALVLEDCVVTCLFVEPKGGFGVSSADNVLAHIDDFYI